ncbi:MAG: DUF1540 domain-containing protein [Eubacteriales bacterium]|nr:DUF1540 domain-containing protein [Eubacteriales bacterium]
MNQKNANTDIRCSVESCVFHCNDCNYCSLQSIQVEPRKDCNTGCACDESMCASYRSR